MLSGGRLTSLIEILHPTAREIRQWRQKSLGISGRPKVEKDQETDMHREDARSFVG
jgi:hypothetical protein